MKLPDFFTDERLNRAKERMGIPREVYGSLTVNIEPGRLTEDELDRLTSGEGIDVQFKELTILRDGTLAYKDSRVLVYIRDVHLMSTEQQMPKYHFYNCSTLKAMNESGRFDRYVVSARVDGLFDVRLIEKKHSQRERARLNVCKNCLNDMRFKGYSHQSMSTKQKDQFVAEFAPSEFFALYPRSLLIKQPVYDSEHAPKNEYTEDWEAVSLLARTAVGWRCQLCQVDLGSQHLRRFLQTHHKNGLRWDNSAGNLEVLCLKCHASRPQHAHLRKHPDYTEFICLFPGS